MVEQRRIHRAEESSKQYRASAEDMDQLADDDTDRQAAQERHAEIDEITKEILDEIDTVLEDNPQTFVDGYVQEGGE